MLNQFFQKCIRNFNFEIPVNNDHCMESVNRKCGWFGSPAILLSGISKILSAQLYKNVKLNT